MGKVWEFSEGAKTCHLKERGCRLVRQGGAGVWETTQFISELCILKPVYGLFHSWRLKEASRMESDHSVTTCKRQPLHLSDLAGCGDYFSLGIHTTNCSPSLFVFRGNLWDSPEGCSSERCAGRASNWRAGSPTKQLEVAGKAGVLYLKKSLKFEKKPQ